MSRRDHFTLEQQERERAANRLRMRKLLADPAYREKVNTRRRLREAERKAADPSLIVRRRATAKRYYDRKHGEPAFEAKRVEQHRRSRHERRANEQFEAFLSRIESEAP